MYFKSLFGDSENLIRLGTSTLYNVVSLRQQEYMFEIWNKTSFADGILHYVCLFLLSFKGHVNIFFRRGDETIHGLTSICFIWYQNALYVTKGIILLVIVDFYHNLILF